MTTAAEKRARIQEIETILQSGVTTNSVEGETTSFNHDTLREERTRLEQQLGRRQKRHRVFNFNMGGG